MSTNVLAKKSAQLCPNIVQNGALLKNNFCPKNIWSKLGNFKLKSSPNLEFIKANIWRFFEKLRPNYSGDILQEKMRPKPNKYHPNGEISPNLVTLDPTHLQTHEWSSPRILATASSCQNCTKVRSATGLPDFSGHKIPKWKDVPTYRRGLKCIKWR
jgi:hypothetical protein